MSVSASDFWSVSDSCSDVARMQSAMLAFLMALRRWGESELMAAGADSSGEDESQVEQSMAALQQQEAL